MADIIDRANETADTFMSASMSRITLEPQLPAVGMCYYCNENVGPGLRFCDADCRDDFAHEQAAKARNGER